MTYAWSTLLFTIDEVADTSFRVFESAVNAVYWFPFFYTFKFVLVLWLALPQFG